MDSKDNNRLVVEEILAETAKQIQESRVAFDLEMQKIREAQAATIEQTIKQLKQSSADYDRRMINFEKTMGSWSNNHGSFTEEYFFNSFDNGIAVIKQGVWT